ncbi:MAG: methylated-DNA--[protein]-cysteine S-methyltransferase [Bacteroidetes bacterium]|nr:methylated-DNA--[protein]-cysteine S-methyltransferase [Bacteroidota bacterium]
MHDYYRVAEALKYIKDNMQDQPNLDKIAKNIHVSPFHFQRIFTDWAGISPKKFLQYISVEHAKKILKQNGTSVYDAAYDTGLSGTGRLHDLFVNIEGMTPGEYKNGGKNLSIQYSFHECQFGNFVVASTSAGICNLLFFEKSAFTAEKELRSLWPNASFFEGENLHHKSVQKFFENDFSQVNKIKLHLKGTPFQLKVWEALLRIPEGHLSSYSDIAGLIHQPTAQRAVGTAIGNNPVGFIIPCHRVIKNLGGIGEYRWGAARKMAMIGWEAAKNETA